MLQFVKGNSSAPSGNLIVFCNVVGLNPLQPDGKYIVCHVVVSFVSASQNNFPVVVFPPTSLMDSMELQKIIDLHPYSDVVQLPDFEIPSGHDEKEYMNDRLEQFNQGVIEYVEICRNSIQDRMKEKGDAPRLITLQTQSLPRPAQPPRDEKSSLEMLEKVVKDESSMDMDTIISHFQTNYPKYDIQNLVKILELKNSPPLLSGLYLKKFRAIFEENYEEAANLQNRIHILEKQLSSAS